MTRDSVSEIRLTSENHSQIGTEYPSSDTLQLLPVTAVSDHKQDLHENEYCNNASVSLTTLRAQLPLGIQKWVAQQICWSIQIHT